jgi:hypothetical protein
MRGRSFLSIVVLSLSLSAVAACADEIRLKDGTKITGTIVGFESDSFRIETSYGFALVRKDMVADISISAPSKRPEPNAKSTEQPPQSSVKSGTASPAVFPTVTRETITPANAPPDTEGVMQPAPATAKTSRQNGSPATTPASNKTTQTLASSGPNAGHSAVTAKAEPAVAKAPTPTASGSALGAATKGGPPVTDAKTVAATSAGAAPEAKSAALPAAAAGLPAPPAALATPPAPPGPPVIRDEIRGNQYVNVTYGFQMYRAPSWDVIPAARKSLPGAVAALGTSDNTTMLVIGRDHAKDSLDAHAAATEKALGEAYDNYRLISTRHVSVAGLPAVEQRSRGTADGHDWSVTLLTLFTDGDAYTLLGMTWADSDLIQVQENVIEKALNSFTFTAK